MRLDWEAGAGAGGAEALAPPTPSNCKRCSLQTLQQCSHDTHSELWLQHCSHCTVISSHSAANRSQHCAHQSQGQAEAQSKRSYSLRLENVCNKCHCLSVTTEMLLEQYEMTTLLLVTGIKHFIVDRQGYTAHCIVLLTADQDTMQMDNSPQQSHYRGATQSLG